MGRSAIYLRTMTTATTRQERAYSPAGSIGRRLARAKRLQLQIQQLDAELSRDREFLLAHMQRHQLDRITTEGFLVVRKVRHNWSYSAPCDHLALQLRQLQLDEQAFGVATDSPKSYISLSAKP
jgi:hypothetical protein